MVNLPTALTLARFLMVPLLPVFFYLPTHSSNILVAAVFVLAAMTDILDGYLARQLSQVTRLGAFLDPVADKLIVVTALVLIVEDAASWTITLPALVIIAREITVCALRGWMAEIGPDGSGLRKLLGETENLPADVRDHRVIAAAAIFRGGHGSALSGGDINHLVHARLSYGGASPPDSLMQLANPAL